MRALLLLDAEDEADMRKKDGSRYRAKTAKVVNGKIEPYNFI